MTRMGVTAGVSRAGPVPARKEEGGSRWKNLSRQELGLESGHLRT